MKIKQDSFPGKSPRSPEKNRPSVKNVRFRISIGAIKHQDRSSVWRGRVTLPGNRASLRDSRQEVQQVGTEAGTLLSGLLLTASSTCFLEYHLPSDGTAHGGLALLNQSLIKTMLYRLAYKPVLLAFS